jgi:hypothetical protein
MIAFYLLVGLCCLAALFFVLRRRRPLTDLVHSAAWGLGGLGFVHAMGYVIGPLLPLSPLAVGVCCLLGLPGLIGLLFLRLMWAI